MEKRNRGVGQGDGEVGGTVRDEGIERNERRELVGKKKKRTVFVQVSAIWLWLLRKRNNNEYEGIENTNTKDYIIKW